MSVKKISCFPRARRICRLGSKVEKKKEDWKTENKCQTNLHNAQK